jgi:hypothetical protein
VDTLFQAQVAMSIEEFFTPEGLVSRCLEYSFELEHIMEPNKLRMLDSLFSMLRQAVRTIVQYNQLRVHPIEFMDKTTSVNMNKK